MPKSRGAEGVHDFTRGEYLGEAKPAKKSAPVEKWHPEEYKVTPDVINKRGVPLTSAQVDRLMRAITGKHPPVPIADCYSPHHILVFYDSHHQPVAYLEVCFDCNQKMIEPSASFGELDWAAVAALVQELGLPIYRDHKDYSRLREREHAPHRRQY